MFTSREDEPESYFCVKCMADLPYRLIFETENKRLWMREKCECEQAIEREAETRRIEQLTAQNYRAASGLTGELAEKQLSTLEGIPELSEAIKYAKYYIAGFPIKKKWLVFSGGYGVGKTHIAASIGNELLSRMVNLKFVVIPDMLETIWQSYTDKNILDPSLELHKYKLLILDELGAGSGKTPWLHDRIYSVINSAYLINQPVIITTNCRNIKELGRAIGGRALDRLVHRTVWCDITRESYRQQTFKQRRGE